VQMLLMRIELSLHTELILADASLEGWAPLEDWARFANAVMVLVVVVRVEPMTTSVDVDASLLVCVVETI